MSACALTLSGCLDIDYNLSLNNDGSGKIDAKVIWSKEMTDFVKSSGKKTNNKPVFSKDGKSVTKFVNGQMVTQEIKPFRNLSELPIDNSRIEVTKVGWSLFGGEKDRVHIFIAQQSPTGKKPSKKRKPTAKEMRDFEKIFGGHHFAVAMHLPCKIIQADPVWFDGRSYKASVRGSDVRWQIPMTVIFSPVSSGIHFNAICQSWSGIKPGATRT